MPGVPSLEYFPLHAKLYTFHRVAQIAISSLPVNISAAGYSKKACIFRIWARAETKRFATPLLCTIARAIVIVFDKHSRGHPSGRKDCPLQPVVSDDHAHFTTPPSYHTPVLCHATRWR